MQNAVTQKGTAKGKFHPGIKIQTLEAPLCADGKFFLSSNLSNFFFTHLFLLFAFEHHSRCTDFDFFILINHPKTFVGLQKTAH